MQSSRFIRQTCARGAYVIFVFALASGIRPALAEDTPDRIQSAVVTVDSLTHDIDRSMHNGQMTTADCVAVIPGFKKAAAGVGVGHGRGFLSCRNGENWSAPAAVTLEGGSLGAQIGAEKVDIVIVSLDKALRSKLTSDRFTIGEDASAAFGNGKVAHSDPNARILFFEYTKGVFAGFDLDGATLKPDVSGNKALYGKTLGNSEIIEGANVPPAAQPLISKLPSVIHP
jgi:SH3 domain-containing YSC84-like protein 1